MLILYRYYSANNELKYKTLPTHAVVLILLQFFQIKLPEA